MLKKLLFIVPLYLAFGIVMAHSVIPHHHDHEIEVASHHHHDNDHDGAKHHHDDEEKSGEEDKDLSHGFEFFHHSGNTIQFVSSQFSVAKLFSSFDFALVPFILFDVRPCESPHVPFGSSPQTNFYSFFYCPQSGLRAPPCIG